MAVTVGVLSETRRRTLEALCDTFAPALEVEVEGELLRAWPPPDPRPSSACASCAR